MHGIYNYISETNGVTKVRSFAGILYLQFMLHVMLFSMLNVSYSYICSSSSYYYYYYYILSGTVLQYFRFKNFYFSIE
jgi:hypothetical protein